MKLIFEFKPKKGIWVIFPTIIYFHKNSEGPFTDITLSWTCFGLTLRIK